MAHQNRHTGYFSPDVRSHQFLFLYAAYAQVRRLYGTDGWLTVSKWCLLWRRHD